MNARVEAYYSNAGKWREALEALRAILLDSPLAEEFKWKSPCYTYQNGNVVAVWGLKNYCALAFFKGALMKDADGLLVAPGENSRSMRKLEFSSAAEVARKEALIKRHIEEAIELEKSGAKVTLPQEELAMPQELVGKLEEDPAFRVAFEGLTPGRQRGYNIYFSQAKQPKTRLSRIEKYIPKILEGKGMHDR